MAVEHRRGLVGKTLMGPGDEKIGKISDVYVGEESGEPEWAAVSVSTGLFRSRVRIVPLIQAVARGDEIVVPFKKGTVQGGPAASPVNGTLTAAEQTALHHHYGTPE